MKTPCTRCGHQNLPELDVCPQCGLRLHVVQDETNAKKTKFWLFIFLSLVLPEFIICYYAYQKETRGKMSDHLLSLVILGFVLQLALIIYLMTL